jgi:lysophospholipid acyltransferase (LPLAT)-like uncharacterized protein
MSPVRRLAYATLAPSAIAVFRCLWKSYRFEVISGDSVESLADEGRSAILTLWHEAIFTSSWYLQRLAGLGLRVTYMVSPSVDGELAVGLLRRLDGQVVRGSATRSGVKALHGLYRAISRDGASPVILPDGPKGPPHECKAGPLLLARVSGVPVLPMACGASSAWRLRTWDRMVIPRPFSRVAIVVGEAQVVPTELDSDSIEGERLKLEQTLEELGARARQALGP